MVGEVRDGKVPAGGGPALDNEAGVALPAQVGQGVYDL
jgi:hypothetical protein